MTATGLLRGTYVLAVAIPLFLPSGDAESQRASTRKAPARRPPARAPRTVKEEAIAVKRDSFPVATARRIAAQDPKKMTPVNLARALLILEQEGSSSEAPAFRRKLQDAFRTRTGKPGRTYQLIEKWAQFYKKKYVTPCDGRLSRVGPTWPPRYHCQEAPPGKFVPPEPTPVVRLWKEPTPIEPAGEPDEEKPEKLGDERLLQRRLREITLRDGFALPGERLDAYPRQFCVNNRCYSNYQQVASAIYGQKPSSQRLPVFCAPKREPSPRKSGDPDLRSWQIDKVHCTSEWVKTLEWMPWLPNGKPAKAPEEGRIPPYACFGSPHLISHMVLPPGGQAGNSGFYCRKRVFRVLATKAEQRLEDVNQNLANLCLEMREQVWGEQYKNKNMNINEMYARWCMSKEGPRDKSMCPRLKKGPGGQLIKPVLPFMLLSREELMFFYGHKPFFCRADRKGLLHFLDPEHKDQWAKTFTCGIGRGLVEAGPFEEGVQVCALAPFFGGFPPRARGLRDPYKARLHCWKFNRPTCEEASKDPTKDSIYKSQVFDAFDALKEFRRTRRFQVLSFYDMKDAEKVPGFAETLAFSDAGKDEGVFGVKDFCRFVGDLRHIQCGFNKETIAHWYEYRKDELPLGCGKGVCDRGAYKRGYYCGLFATREMFNGKPYWMCGIDTGMRGREILRSAKAICVGGKAVARFQSSKGDQSSLQCYERRFRWAESEASRKIAEGVDWPAMVQRAAEEQAKTESPGGAPVVFARGRGVLRSPFFHLAFYRHRLRFHEIRRHEESDVRELLKWAREYGHTLGHRTSMRIGLMRSEIKVIQEFTKIKVGPDDIGRTDAEEMKEGVKPEQLQKSIQQEKEGRAKDIMELISEVAEGDRAADERWWQEFENTVQDGGKVRLTPQKAPIIQIAKRVHRLFLILDRARAELLGKAREYAKAVLERAKKLEREGHPMLARQEVHEEARDWKGFKGNLFCVGNHPPGSPPPAAKGGKKPKFFYICGGSPLLLAGVVELAVDARRHEFVPAGGSRLSGAALEQEYRNQFEKFQAKIRSQVKTEWCYGGVADLPIFGENPSPVMYASDLSSPFQMDPPETVVDPGDRLTKSRSPQLWTSTTNWLKCAGFQYSDESWMRAVPGKGKDAPRTDTTAKVDENTPIKPTGPVGPTGPSVPAGPGAAQAKVDAQAEDFGRQISGAVASDSRVKAEDARKAKEKGKEMMDKIGGFIGKLIDMAMPELGKLHEFVMTAANPSDDFLSEWEGKFVEKAEKIWDQSIEQLTRKAEQIEKDRDRLKAEIEAAEEKFKTDVLDKAQEAFNEAEEKLKQTITEQKDKVAETIDAEKTKFAEAVQAARDKFDAIKAKLQQKLDKARDAAEKAEIAYQSAPPTAKDKFEARREEAKSQLAEARSEYTSGVAEARSDFKNAEKEAKKAMEDAIIKGAKAEAKAAIKEAKKKRDEAEKALNKAKADYQKLQAENRAKMQKFLADKRNEFTTLTTRIRDQNKTLPESGRIAGELIDAMTKMLTGGLRQVLEPYAKKGFDWAWKFVDQVLRAIRQALIGALAGIPFVGGALAPIGGFLYDFACDTLKDFVFTKLMDLAELLLGKAVRGLVAKLIQPLQKQILKRVHANCMKRHAEVFASESSGAKQVKVCPANFGEMKMARLPARHRWLERALGCRRGPLIDQEVWARALRARRAIMREGEEMIREAPMYARSIANDYLAYFGYTYDSWKLAFAGGPTPQLLARAGEINQALRARLEEMKKRLGLRATK